METIIETLPVGEAEGADMGVYPDTKQWAQKYKENALEAIKDGEDVQTFINEWTEYAKKHGIAVKEHKTSVTKKKGGESKLDTMNVKQLKDICRKKGIPGFSKLRKAELIAVIKEKNDLEKALLNEAKNIAVETLGKDFGRALIFWKNLKEMESRY